MAKKVSGKTHTKQQLNDYANQNNPNNKAYKARLENDKMIKKSSSKAKKSAALKEAKRRAKFESELGLSASLDWMCYSNPYDFD